jgi:hypothetical protein
MSFGRRGAATGLSSTFVTPARDIAAPGRLAAELRAFRCYGAVPGPGGFLNGGLRRDWSMMLNSR